MARSTFMSPGYSSRAASLHPTQEPARSGSPAVSFSSDKENRNAESPETRDKDGERAERVSSAASASQAPLGERNGSNKRRKISKSGKTPLSTQSARRESSTKYYDPDQNEEERRETAKALRDLTKELHDNSRDYIKDGNSGLFRTITKADEIFENVKQTGDATIDSNLLVNASNLSFKKCSILRLGDQTSSLEVDEFVSKCRTFMLNDNNRPSIPEPTQPAGNRRRASNQQQVDPTECQEWHVFGCLVAHPSNARPSVPSFLLGPLSILPRARKTIRRATQRNTGPTLKPQEIRNEDIEQQRTTTNNITVKCTEIKNLLSTVQTERSEAVEAAVEELEEKGTYKPEDLPDLMKRHQISTNGGINLFQFAINPKSFGQTVENLFYISFLIREGGVAVVVDDDGLPTLHNTVSSTAEEMRANNTQKHQAIFNISYEIWADAIRAFDITEPLIRDRTEEERLERAKDRARLGAGGERGWYS